MNPSVDVNTFVGDYPFRAVPHPDPEALVRVMDREEIAESWVASLPAVWHRDPSHANEELVKRLAPHKARLRCVPTVRPDWPDWRTVLKRARDANAPAIRAYPVHWQLGAGDERLRDLALECARDNVTLVLTVRFEDLRQRHALDTASDLSAATIRELARADTGARIVVTAAPREMIEEAHWGLTPNERSMVWWDISWIWGPPEDHLAHLFRTVGSDRFVYGTGWPLRLAQTPRANLALLPDELRASVMCDPRAWSS